MRGLIGSTAGGELVKGSWTAGALSFVPKLSLILIATLLMSPGSLIAAELPVCKVGCNYSSIASAVEVADSGDIISIKKGTYRENLAIDRDLTLVGSAKGQVVINPESEGRPIITVQGSGVEVTVRSLTVSNAAGEAVDTAENMLPNGITVRSGAGLRLLNVIIYGNEKCGLHLLGGSSAAVVSSSLAQNGNAGCIDDGCRLIVEDTRISGNGLVLTETATATITNSTISNHDDIGIILRDTSSVEITTSRVGTSETGLLLEDNSFISLFDSTVRDAGDGIRLTDNARADVSGSELTDCTSGLELRNNTKASMSGSKVVSNDHGVSLFDAAQLWIADCRIAYNDIGVRCNPGSTASIDGCDIRFYKNFDANTDGLGAEVVERLQDRCRN